MRQSVDPLLTAGRVREGPWSTDDKHGLNGGFLIEGPQGRLKIIASTGKAAQRAGYPPWEHVSVSCPTRTPTWEEMCFVKDLFWGPVEVVMQLHPKRSEYVNCHPFTLHLWRPAHLTIPTPPSIMVGPK